MSDIRSDVIREVIREVQRLCCEADRREAGCDLAITLGNCDRLLSGLLVERDRLRAELTRVYTTSTETIKAELAEIDRLKGELAAAKDREVELSRKLTEAGDALLSLELALEVARTERDEARTGCRLSPDEPPRPEADACPYCGCREIDVMSTYGGLDVPQHFAECMDCHASGPLVQDAERARAEFVMPQPRAAGEGGARC